jgi:hypothetical protein
MHGILPKKPLKEDLAKVFFQGLISAQNEHIVILKFARSL